MNCLQGSPEIRLKKGDISEGKPNLYTNPGKKGSYGYIKTTLSERKCAGGMHGEYTYAAEPFDRAKQLEREAKKKAPKVTDSPFVPTNPPKKGSYGWIKTNIGNKAQGSVGELAYKPQGYEVPQAKRDKKLETAFVPPRAPKTGYNCTFGKYPELHADPEHLKIHARRQALKEERDALTGGNPWHPPNIPKIGATRSIVRMNV
jgi:Domain of unknown function (DUF4586)